MAVLNSDLSNLELKERDLFNQRKGEMRKNLETITRDIELFDKRVRNASNRIRNFDFFNIGFGSVLMIIVVILGILASVSNINYNFIGISVASLSGFEIIKNLSILLAIKLYFKKQKEKYITLRDIANKYHNRLYLYVEKILEDFIISFDELTNATNIFNEYIKEKNKLCDIENFSEKEKMEFTEVTTLSKVNLYNPSSSINLSV